MSKKVSKPPPARLVRVPLKFQLPEAVTVNVAGSFNDWDPTALSMNRTDHGDWVLDLCLAPGRHEFRLVVDGVWADAVGATEYVENIHGSRNAVLIVATPPGK